MNNRKLPPLKLACAQFIKWGCIHTAVQQQRSTCLSFACPVWFPMQPFSFHSKSNKRTANTKMTSSCNSNNYCLSSNSMLIFLTVRRIRGHLFCRKKDWQLSSCLRCLSQAIINGWHQGPEIILSSSLHSKL
jgi:hypothetical protein